MARHDISESPAKRGKSPSRRDMSPPRRMSSPRSDTPVRATSSHKTRSSEREKPPSRAHSPRTISPPPRSPSPRTRSLRKAQAERGEERSVDWMRETEEEKNDGDLKEREMGIEMEKNDVKERMSERDADEPSRRMCERSYSPADHHGGEKLGSGSHSKDRKLKEYDEDNGAGGLEPNGNDDYSVARMKAAEETLAKKKEQPSFELSGKLVNETNRVKESEYVLKMSKGTTNLEEEDEEVVLVGDGEGSLGLQNTQNARGERPWVRSLMKVKKRFLPSRKAAAKGSKKIALMAQQEAAEDPTQIQDDESMEDEIQSESVERKACEGDVDPPITNKGTKRKKQVAPTSVSENRIKNITNSKYVEKVAPSMEDEIQSESVEQKAYEGDVHPSITNKRTKRKKQVAPASVLENRIKNIKNRKYAEKVHIDEVKHMAGLVKTAFEDFNQLYTDMRKIYPCNKDLEIVRKDLREYMRRPPYGPCWDSVWDGRGKRHVWDGRGRRHVPVLFFFVLIFLEPTPNEQRVAESFTSDLPWFVQTLKWKQLEMRYSFLKEHSLIWDNNQDIVLRVPCNSDHWCVKLNEHDYVYKFGRGLALFLRENGVKEGDVLIFEVVKSSPSEMEMLVHKPTLA